MTDSTYPTPPTSHALLKRAADIIQEERSALFECHSIDGEITVCDEGDEHAVATIAEYDQWLLEAKRALCPLPAGTEEEHLGTVALSQPASEDLPLDDLAARLRRYRPRDEFGDPVKHTICDEAADEIERLRTPPPQDHVVPAELCDLTFAIQHNPRCPSPWLVRLVGKSGTIDMKPYGGPFAFMKHETTDRLGFGKTLKEAARAALCTDEGQEITSYPEAPEPVGYIGKASLDLMRSGQTAACAMTQVPPKVKEVVALFEHPSLSPNVVERTVAPVEVYRIIKDVVIDKENVSAWSRRIAAALSDATVPAPSSLGIAARCATYEDILRVVCGHLELPQSESGPADDVQLYDRALEAMDEYTCKADADLAENTRLRFKAEAQVVQLRKALADMVPPKLTWKERDADGFLVHHQVAAINAARAALAASEGSTDGN